MAALCLLLAGVACGDGSPRKPESARPNFVLVLTDDLRHDTLGAAGHPFVRTPHIDRLAGEGLLFENSFVVTAVCCPSRASLLTGRYTHRTGVTGNVGDLDYEATPTLPQRLAEAGYDTAFVGKYHLGSGKEPRPGYHRWIALEGKGGHGDYIDPRLNVDGTSVELEGYNTDLLTDRAVDWIRDRRGAPFFLLLSLKSVHVPLTPAPRHQTLYRDATVAIPDSFHDPRESLPLTVQRSPAADREKELLGTDGRPDPERLAALRRDYARMVPSVDDSVGRLYTTLQEEGLLENTIVLFTSDNGRLLGEHGLIRKGSALEPSMRVPLIVRPAGGLEQARRPRIPVLNVDLAPTLLELAGAPPDEATSGASFAALLGDDPRRELEWRSDWLYIAAYTRTERPRELAVLAGRWKYIRYLAHGLEERLFDLEADPGERRDLAGDARHRQELDRMRGRMRALVEEQGIPELWLEPFAAAD